MTLNYFTARRLPCQDNTGTNIKEIFSVLLQIIVIAILNLLHLPLGV